MRQFDSYEREFIRLIGKIDIESNETFPRFLQNNYFTIENNTALVVIHDIKSVILFLPPNVFYDDKKRAFEIKKFWSLVGLVEYLNEKRYIKCIPITSNPNLQLMSQRFDDSIHYEDNKLVLNKKGDYIIKSDADKIYDENGNVLFIGVLFKDLYEPISKNLLGIIFPSESIKFLIENSFNSEEDYRFKKQYVQTWIGIGISFILGLFSILYSLYNTISDRKYEEEHHIIIDDIVKSHERFNTIILNKFDSIANKELELNDTLNVNGKE